MRASPKGLNSPESTTNRKPYRMLVEIDQHGLHF